MDFFIADSGNLPILTSFYSYKLVALSFLVATAGSGLALYVVNTATHTQGPQLKRILMGFGALAFGLAVWSMHFIGMLALEICTTVKYDSWTTALSALPAVAAAAVALRWISHKNLSFSANLRGGVVMGAGIGVMHYTGMLAMRMAALLRFDPYDFALSIFSAVSLATLALWCRTGLRHQFDARFANFLAAIVMGGAITTMHYLGMHAARFIGTPDMATPVPPQDAYYLSILITMGITSMLGLVASGVLYARLRESLDAVQLREIELETIIQNSTEAIITASFNGTIASVNKAFETIFGSSIGEAKGTHLSSYLPQWSSLLQQQASLMNHETIGKRSDGSEFPIRIALNRIDTELLTFYVGFVMDLSHIKMLQDKLMNDANHDFLTGLWNRRYFEEQLQQELHRCERSGAPVALLMLDIDHFKTINDTYGHLAGDKVLARLAAELQKHMRSGDVVARYGGEEFILLLPNTDIRDAEDVAERMRAHVEGLKLTYNGNTIRFTVSVGVTSTQTAGANMRKQLIELADGALYQAKRSGRNRVRRGVNSDRKLEIA